MADTLPPEELARRQRAMRALTDDYRAETIASASNVVGFERFIIRARQVQLRNAYRKPPAGAPA